MRRSKSAEIIFTEYEEIGEIESVIFESRRALEAKTGRRIEFGAINSPPLFEKISYFPHILIYRS